VDSPIFPARPTAARARDEDRTAYLATSQRNTEMLGDGWDFVVTHDPRPAAMVSRFDP
jgi:hypothetical protein